MSPPTIKPDPADFWKPGLPDEETRSKMKAMGVSEKFFEDTREETAARWRADFDGECRRAYEEMRETYAIIAPGEDLENLVSYADHEAVSRLVYGVPL